MVGAIGFEPTTPCAQGLVPRGVNNLAPFVWSEISLCLCGFLALPPTLETNTNKPPLGTKLGTVDSRSPRRFSSGGTSGGRRATEVTTMAVRAATRAWCAQTGTIRNGAVMERTLRENE